MEEFDSDLIEYLKEFESTVRFDGEICPTCGLDFTRDEVKVAKWISYKDDLAFNELEKIAEILDEEKVHYYFTKNDSSKNNLYMLLVLNNSIKKVDKIFSGLLH